MTRWKVEKAQVLHYDENCKVRFGPAWRVISPAGMPWGNYPTHAEALEYADRMARTVEVVLPRVAPHPSYGYIVHPEDPWVYSWPNGKWHLAPIGDWDGHAALLCNDFGEYKIHADELKPLALALLALAEQEGQA